MPRSLPADLIASLEDDVLYPFFAVELLFDEGTFTPVPVATSTPVERVVRLWTGIGTLTYKQKEYFGVGTLLEISAIEETAEIAARGASITLSGIPSSVISLALSEPYQGRGCNIYFGTFASRGSGNVGGKVLKEDTDFVLLEDGSKITLDDRSTQLTQVFAGYMDTMNIEESAETCTVELTVENKLITLERARVARYTSAFQKSLYPNDKGLDFIEDMQDKSISWGSGTNSASNGQGGTSGGGAQTVSTTEGDTSVYVDRGDNNENDSDPKEDSDYEKPGQEDEGGGWYGG
jgi:hypothetical protein